jgi:hypothetical protein
MIAAAGLTIKTIPDPACAVSCASAERFHEVLGELVRKGIGLNRYAVGSKVGEKI